MSIIGKIFGKQVKDVTDGVGNILDTVITNNEEKAQIRNQISDLILDSMLRVMDAQSSILKTEMKGNWLQRSWRPLTMLVFVFIITARFLGFATVEIPIELEREFFNLVKIGLGGYVVGRSVEKTANTLSRGIDLPFLKKKERAEYLKSFQE